MNYEAWVDPVIRGHVPMIDPMPLEKAEFSYTPKQRAWWLRVYDNQCAFPRYDEARGWYPCGSTEKLEVHHITPSAWIKAQMPWQDPNEIIMEEGIMGIVICRWHHDQVIHPDIGDALRHYHDVEGTNTIKEAVSKHQEMSVRGDKFWEDQFDQMLIDTASQYINNYIMGHPEDLYPQDGKWKREHLQ